MYTMLSKNEIVYINDWIIPIHCLFIVLIYVYFEVCLTGDKFAFG